MRFWRSFGLIAFTVLLAALLLFSIAITPQYISDSDASTYAIVPILMLPVFSIFMFKYSERMVPDVDAKSIALGAVLFAAFLVLVLDMRAYLGPLFFSYRMDMLLLPIAILALASLTLGRRNLPKFTWIALYALAASPLIMLPVINANLSFASVNSLGIYYISATFFHNAQFISPVTISYNGSQISIGNSCIGIGALVGLVLFLAPIAYFLEGRLKGKALWTLGGLALMLILNFVRMLAITFAWFDYGPNQTILDIHAIVGQLIFYATILIMLMAAGRYGLAYPRIRLGRRRTGYDTRAIAIAMLFSALYLFVSASYLGAAQVPLTSITNNTSFNWKSASQLYGTYFNYSGTSYSEISSDNRSLEITMLNSSNATEAVAIFSQRAVPGLSGFESNLTLEGWKEYMYNGNISYIYLFGTHQHTYLYYSAIAYGNGQGEHILDMYLINAGTPAGRPGCQDAYDVVYGYMANIAGLNPNTFNPGMDSAYCAARRFVR